MDFVNIFKTKLYISSIFSVIKSERTVSAGKEFSISSRHSDAFIFVLSGSCLYSCVGSLPFTASEGDVIYLAKGADYKMLHTEEETFSYIYCDFDFDGNFPRACAVIPTLERGELQDMFSRLYKSYIRDSFSSHAESLSLLYKIYSELIFLSERDYISSPSSKKIREIKEEIDDTFTHPSLSVESLADNAGISEVYMRRLFKSEFGISPSQYIISKRIANAEALMKEKTLSIEECAKQSGFSSLQYFSRIYKAKKGVSPCKSR